MRFHRSETGQAAHEPDFSPCVITFVLSFPMVPNPWEYDRLPETEQHEVLARLIHRLIDSPYVSLPDEDFTQAADLIFQEFDRIEPPG